MDATPDYVRQPETLDDARVVAAVLCQARQMARVLRCVAGFTADPALTRAAADLLGRVEGMDR